jgi:glycosyltransferase involved in cell wall biosynthesis
VRQALGLSLHIRLIGYVGNIYTRDAVLMAVAFNQVYQKEPRARLLLVGYFNRNLEAWLDHPEAIIRTGSLSSEQIHQYLSACDLCWLPLCDTGANRGRWPLKLNDYMAAGRPVVATQVGDLPEVISRHLFGILARPEPEDFASQTLALLADPHQCEVLGQAARRAAEEAFTWEYLTEELEAFYQHVLRCKGRK